MIGTKYSTSSRWTWIVGPLAIIGAVAMLARLLDASAEGEVDIKKFGDATSLLTANDGTAIASVNGVAIPKAKLEAFKVLSTADGGFSNSEISKYSDDQYVDMLIDGELLFQEAQSRGLVPTDAEVLEEAKRTKETILETLKEDTPLIQEMKALQDEIKGTPYHVDVYDSSPIMLDSFRHSIAWSRLRAQEFQKLPEADRQNVAARERVMDELKDRLRASANIEKYAVDTP